MRPLLFELPLGSSKSNVKERRIINKISAEKVLTALCNFAEYDSINGGLIAIRKRLSTSPSIGEQLGTTAPNGYKYLSVCNKLFLLHRLVWLLHFEKWPEYELDHFDGNKANNRIENLRLCDSIVNSRNSKKRINNTTGYTGVRYHKTTGRWSAFYGDTTGENPKAYKHIGMADSAEEAYELRQQYFKLHPELGFTLRHGHAE